MDTTLKIGSVAISNTGGKEITIDTTPEGATEQSAKKRQLGLLSVSYHKKMYQPGFVLAKVQLTRADYTSNKTIGLTGKQIIDNFKNQTITLSRGSDTVASDYYIYKVSPEFKRNKDQHQYVDVTLYCYSRDHMLTVDKYCKTYVNQKLVGDPSKSTDKIDGIILRELHEGILKVAGFTTSTIDYNNLRLLKFAIDSKTKREFIQPYLVQYNESFYDFLARTANRCGEFLYHEDGILHIGTPATDTKAAVDLETSKVLAYRYVGQVDHIINSNLLSRDGGDLGANNKTPDLYADSTGSYIYYEELPIDEYLGMILTTNQFTSYEKEFVKDWRYIIVDILNNVLNSVSLPMMAAKLLEKYGEAAILATSKSLLKNADKKGKWIDPADDERKYFYMDSLLDLPLLPTTKVSLYGSMLSQATQQLNYLEQQNLNAKFYQFVDKCSKQVAQKLVEVDVDEKTSTCALGNVVTLDGDTYVVIEVKETLLSEVADTTAGQKLVLVPMLNADVLKYTKTENEEDIYDTKATLSLFCPPPMVPFVRTVGAQRAFVAKNGDPEGLGRVCIRYPWQKASDTESPWIRIAVPFAPNDAVNDNAGFFFEPAVGDEVLVDYENGNIEHPIIVGSLYTRRTPAPTSDRSIVSRKGHSLSFNDGDSGSDFFAGIMPAYSLAAKYASLGNAKIDWLGDDCVSGGITLSDKWGLYKIAASSTERKITIKSPFGDVDISAFSGITISAPNGDISIKGKNVTIEAGNELKLISGKSIDEKKEYEETFKKSLLTSTVSSLLAPILDFSLLRTMMEALLKPVAGTLTVQSGRYLLLMAGGGKAEIPQRGLSIDGIYKGVGNNDQVVLANTLAFTKEIANKWVDDIAALYGVVKARLTPIRAMGNAPAQMTAPDPNDILTALRGHLNTEYTNNDITLTDANGDKDTVCAHLNIARTYLANLEDYCKNPYAHIGIGKGQQIHTASIRFIIRSIPDNLLPPLFVAVKNQTATFTGADPNWGEAKKLLRRVMAVKLLTESTKYGKMIEQKKDDNIHGGTTVDFNQAGDYIGSNNNNWDDFIKLLVEHEQTEAEKYGEAFFNKLSENMPLVGWKAEHYLWDTYKVGEILMADKGSTETINIVNGALNRTKNTMIIDRVKDILRNF